MLLVEAGFGDRGEVDVAGPQTIEEKTLRGLWPEPSPCLHFSVDGDRGGSESVLPVGIRGRDFSSG